MPFNLPSTTDCGVARRNATLNVLDGVSCSTITQGDRSGVRAARVSRSWRDCTRRYAGDARIPAGWHEYFDRMIAEKSSEGVYRREPSFVRRSIFHPASGNGRAPGDVQQERVDQLIRNYRVRGHMIACLDPLDQPRSEPPELHPEFYGFSAADLDRTCSTTWAGGPEVRTPPGSRIPGGWD